MYCTTQESDGDCCSERDARLAKLAWMTHAARMKLLHEKIRAKLEATEGAKLDQLAQLAIDALSAQRAQESASDAKWDEFERRLDELWP
jgi:hypothetical protein